jgi:hypothetical protein
MTAAMLGHGDASQQWRLVRARREENEIVMVTMEMRGSRDHA